MVGFLPQSLPCFIEARSLAESELTHSVSPALLICLVLPLIPCIRGHRYVPFLHDTRSLNSGPHTWATSTFPNESSSWSLFILNTSIHFIP